MSLTIGCVDKLTHYLFRHISYLKQLSTGVANMFEEYVLSTKIGNETKLLFTCWQSFFFAH